MKEYMEVIQGANPYHTELSLRVTGGPVCKKKHKNMLKSVISAKDLL